MLAQGGADETSPDGEKSNKNKIVVGVDDNADNLGLLSRIVTRAGYSFLSATSGSECLDLLARVVPQFILLDIEMPDLDGFEVCRRLRADARFAQVPIAFLTARHSEGDVKKGIAAGGNDFVLKPLNRTRLLERLHYWTRHPVKS